MHKKLLALLMVILMLPVLAMAEEQRVFMAGETEPFAEGEQLLTLRVVPVLSADSALLTYGEHSMLVDMARPEQAKDVMNILADAGLERVEYAFSTHPHVDHLGGMIPMINAGIQFDQFLTVYPHEYVGNACIQRASVKAIKQAGIPVVDVGDGDTIEFGDVEITVLRQTSNKDDNERSAMLMIRYGKCSMLLTADVGGDGQPILVGMHDPNDLNVDIMKYPHHGLNRLRPEFMEATSPEFVYVPHGAVDTKDAQRQLAKAGIDVMFATWGPIVIQSNGEKWIVEQHVFDKMKEYAANYQLK